MKRLGKILMWSGVALTALVAIVVAGVLIIRNQTAASMAAIEGAKPISEAKYVAIGGLSQWIRIRGQNLDNPVILYLHGGPGGAISSLTYAPFRNWEHDFTVVQWDQRGAGRTYAANKLDTPLTLTIERMAQDGIEVAEYLRARLGKRKIVIVGHSWGSLLGLHMIQRRPDLFSAYVAVGLAADVTKSQSRLYATALTRARADNNKEAIRELEEVATQPETNTRRFTTIRKWVATRNEPLQSSTVLSKLYPLLCPEYSIHDFDSQLAGATISRTALMPQIMADELPRRATHYQVPMFLLQGAQDGQTSSEAAREYFEALTAPVKEIVIFPGAGHFVHLRQSGKFLAEMQRLVLPVAVESASVTPLREPQRTTTDGEL